MDHVVECIEYMHLLGSNTLVIWLPDGINSPGQMSLYEMADRLDAAFTAVAELLKPGEKLMVEYKPFEPAFYASAIPDWGSALDFCRRAGSNASVLVDLGHHLPGANVEQVVMHLIRTGRLGGFHFNDRKYADDDLASGSIDPAGLFRIFANLVEAENRDIMPMSDIAFMIDESHNIKDPLEEMIESLLNIETALIKALIIDWEKLYSAMDAADPVRADEIMRDAFLTDVRPILEKFRSNNKLPPDPLKAAIAGRD
jgi:L-rhamnose isomerase/sugar isomerase